MSQHLQVDTRDGVCRVTFTRPEAFNAMTEEMAVEFVEALTRAAAEDSVRVVLVTGTGPAFSAGVDLVGENPVESFGDRTLLGANQIIRSVTGLGKPVVVAVNGIAAGVGDSICFAADLAVATESASFLLAFSLIGLMPDGGSSLTVASSVGRAKAMRMALLGEAVTASEAFEAGLVSHFAPDGEFDAVVERLVRRLAQGPGIAFAATKRAVNAATIGDLEGALERERAGQVALFGTEDAAEGMRAFLEKRKPRFSGR